jgi:hypothetical protein
MAYVKTDWVDHSTLVDEARLEHMEQGIYDAHQAISLLEAEVPDVVSGKWLKGASGAMVWADITQADVQGLTAALAAKQDTSQKAQANGYASLDAATKVPAAQLPDQSAVYQPRSEEGQANGYASLDGTTKVPVAQLPDLSATYQARAERAVANGYPSLGSDGKVPLAQLPPVGADLAYEAAWSAATAYTDGDIVIDDGISYMAVRPSTNSKPKVWPGPTMKPPSSADAELAYVENLTNVTITGTTHAASHLIVSLPALSFDGVQKVRICGFVGRVDAPAAGGANIVVGLYEAGTTFIRMFGMLVNPAAGTMGAPLYSEILLTPTAGSHTFAMRSYVSSGTGLIVGNPSGIQPQFLRALRA